MLSVKLQLPPILKLLRIRDIEEPEPLLLLLILRFSNRQRRLGFSILRRVVERMGRIVSRVLWLLRSSLLDVQWRIDPEACWWRLIWSWISVPIGTDSGNVVGRHRDQGSVADRSRLDVRTSNLFWIYVILSNGVSEVRHLIKGLCQQESACIVPGIAGIQTTILEPPVWMEEECVPERSAWSTVVPRELKRLERRVNDMRPGSGQIRRATLSPKSYTLRNPACMQHRTTSPRLMRSKLVKTTLRVRSLRLYICFPVG